MQVAPFNRLAAVVVVLAFLGVARGQDAQEQAGATSRSSDEKVTTTTTYDKVVVERETRVRETEVKLKPRKVKPIYVAAIFVKNRAARVPDEKVLVVQDFMNAHLNGKGFKIISREDVINKVADFATEGPNRGDKELPGEKIDQMLSNNTSALRLAENISADYILNVAVTQYGRDAVRYRAEDIDHTTVTHKLKLTYTLLDTTVGGAMTSGMATATFVERFQPGLTSARENTIDDLLDGAAADLCNLLETAAKGDAITSPETMAAAKKEVPFTIYCAVADLTVPEVIKDKDGHYVVKSGTYKVEPLAFTVELDGTVIGSTNVERDEEGRPLDTPNFSARPGLHKMRIRRELFKDWEGTVNIKAGLKLTVAMVMTQEGLDQFLGLGREFNSWKKDQMLTEVQIKYYENYLRTLAEADLRPIDRDHHPIGRNRRGDNDNDGVNVSVKVSRADKAGTDKNSGAKADDSNKTQGDAAQKDKHSDVRRDVGDTPGNNTRPQKTKDADEKPPVDPALLPSN